MNKCMDSLRSSIADIFDGATILVGGFGEVGSPIALLNALADHRACDLTIVSNNAGRGADGLAGVISTGKVKKLICSFPRAADSPGFADLYRKGAIELELVPQGTLAERIRAAGAGIPAFYTPTAVGTDLAKGKELREINGKAYVLEYALHGDFTLARCEAADALGNLVFNKTARNFNPVMCMASRITIVEARKIVPVGTLDPERIVTPGIFVHRVVSAPAPDDPAPPLQKGVSSWVH